MPALQLLVHRHEAHESAQAALVRRAQADEANELGWQAEPRRIGVELEIQIRHRTPHAILQRLVLLHGEALDGQLVDDGKPYPLAELPADMGHDVAAMRQAEVFRREQE